MKRGEISNILRKFRLLHTTDYLRYRLQKLKNYKINREFRLKNSAVKLPPDYLIYESFQLNYQKYYSDGRDAAKWLAENFKKHIDLTDKKILDWGCGPGRIIRHLPEVIGNGCEYFGTDYNERSIDWCKKNLSGIRFNRNSLNADLPYNNDFIDVIFGISIFTHLSEKLHNEWYSELFRVLRPGGIMFLTTQGSNFKTKLTDEELTDFNEGQIVVRGLVKEGHRTFSAFHPKIYMEKLFSNAEILEHIETKPESDTSFPQDIWIIKKN